ncbi:MAG: hypothetical protein KGL39_26305 [Patescibacteria group bacterium]|nr:hypothetical protein [Patescibacteria group bacterium]
MPDVRVHLKEIAHVVNGGMNGQSNNTMQVTLTANVTSTTIVDARISIQTACHMIPLTADAAAAQASGVWVVPAAGSAVIHHASGSAADQSFMVSLIG